MATLYIFEGLDAKRQEATANRYAAAGLKVDVHFHHAWKKMTDNMPAERIPCNLMCYVIEDETVTYLVAKE